MPAVAGSGIRHMSDSLIAFQPAIEEPSNMMPSAKVSSSIIVLSNVTCCHLPRGSVKRKSTYFTSLSFIFLRTSLAVVMGRFPLLINSPDLNLARVSDCVDAGLSGPDPDRFLDIRDEDLAVPVTAGLRRATDRLDGFFNHVVTENNFDLHFGKEIHDVLGATVKLRVPFLASETFGFGDGDALQSHLLQRFLHLVELERLDDRLELLHRVSCPPGPQGKRAQAAAPTVS